ncbi:MAG: pyruvate, phosphate dikinase [Chloroflexi bacterium]|nr:pyruvate, phosphate dikinase [Chloroflexota bacterium]
MSANETAKKWVYLFREAVEPMRSLLGSKGAGLAEMARAGLPVPPGFTITTEACTAYYARGEQFPPGMWEQALGALGDVERETGKGFGDPRQPLLVSVRSGAVVSMPGMMDTVLNVGLNEQTLQGLARGAGGTPFAYDAYRRFIQMFGRVVLGVPGEAFEATLEATRREARTAKAGGLGAEQEVEAARRLLAVVREQAGREFPEDPHEQLRLAIQAVMASWNGRRARDYRAFHRIPDTLGTAVSVVAMVFGNMDERSGTGVAFTRDPSTGARTLYGEYLANAQGEDVVAGVRTPQKISQLAQAMPEVYRQVEEIAGKLEAFYRDAQDLEFTVERGKLYMLQTRSAKRTAAAAVKIAVDMVKEGVLSKDEALLRVEPVQVNQLLLPRFDERAKETASTRGDLLARGLNASPGAASGKAVLDPDLAAQLGGRGESVILVRAETNPDDVHGMLKAKGVLTARGGATSHAAVVARGLGKPCVAGCEALHVDLERRQCVVDGRVVREMEEISIDGTTGEVFVGRLPTIEPNFGEERELITLLGWADEARRLGVWANADYPRDAQRALEFGAEGIGLCRTEHMFFEEERLPIVRHMILAAGEAAALEDELRRLEGELPKALGEQRAALSQRLAAQRARVESSPQVKRYHEALDRLLAFQVQDFKGILRAMTGKPVIIRLLDPPLHEFLPRYEDLLVEVTQLRLGGGDPREIPEKEQLLRAVEAMREANPMLGLRGCRLGLLYGAINQMQGRAIFTAACELAKEGWDPRPEVMVPLVAHVSELRLVRQELEGVAEEVQREQGMRIAYKIGTMIELPRAALTADEIAQEAEFFSFGTNDLTQTTYGISRDDAEGKFLLQYVQRGILPDNPFQVLDRQGVGSLIKTAVELGRKTRPDLEVGICGEHGGDPSSIEFCHQAGLNYVSASPFRVPVARLAAAHAAVKEKKAAVGLPVPERRRGVAGRTQRTKRRNS